MKKSNFYSFIILTILFCNFLTAQILNGRLGTSFYTFEKYDTSNASETYLRAIQSLQLDVTKSDFSIHTLLHGSTTFLGTLDDQSSLKMYNLYFKWRNIGKVADFSFGRQSVFAGVGSGLIDGGTLRLKMFQHKLLIMSYAGVNAHHYLEAKLSENSKDNYSYGGQAVTTFIPDTRFSLSYMNRHKHRDSYYVERADSLGEPITRLINVDSPAEQFISTDLNYNHKSIGRIYGRYDYDLNFKKSSRVQIGGRANVTNQIGITGEYIYRVPRISYNSIFHVFTHNTTTEIEGGLEYAYKPTIRLFGKFAHIEYEDDNSQRYTFGVNAEYGNLIYAGNTGYAGELSTISAQLFYPLFDRFFIPTVGVSRSSYKLTKKDDRLESFTGQLGCTLRPDNYLFFDIQIQWLNNRIYKNDLRLFFRVNYWFTKKLNII